MRRNLDLDVLSLRSLGFSFSHDEWIKLDRVVERKESSNGQALIQPRPRRTSQMNTLRQQYTDSTNSSITGPNSNEPVHQQHLSTINPSIVDVTLLSTSVADDDQQQKTQSSLINRAGSIEKSKPMEIDESDLDDNSQENNRRKWFLLVFGHCHLWCYRSLVATGDDLIDWRRCIVFHIHESYQPIGSKVSSIKWGASINNVELIDRSF